MCIRDSYNNIYLILGGIAKEKNFEILLKYKNKISCVYTYGKSGSFIEKKLKIDKVDGVLLDLGLSSFQLDSKDRGFSFMRDANLDMRFDLDSKIKANDIINRYSEVELADIMYHFGGERMSRKISRNIIKNRPINLVSELVEIIRISTPPNKRNRTLARVFQSFRIAVNNEIGNLKKFLKKYISYVKAGGKIVIISFHSVEDRIVKQSFKSSSDKGILKILTKKPIMASEEEKNLNKRSKSAKLRCAVKLLSLIHI